MSKSKRLEDSEEMRPLGSYAPTSVSKHTGVGRRPLGNCVSPAQAPVQKQVQSQAHAPLSACLTRSE